jgi:putative tricarboxylic transport membrane protein
MMGAFGLILSSVGIDPVVGSSRMIFGRIELADGIGIVPIAMGLFGISEVLLNIEETVRREILKGKIENLFPRIADLIKAKGSIVRGSILGFFLGILPGGGAVIASFVSYGLEKKISKEPETFGKGAIEGVAGPESANNSAASGSFVPLFTLGIPSNIGIAVLFGALLIHGLQPGPFFIKEHPDVFWGVVSSMYIGNLILLILNLPLIPMWVQVLKIPYKLLLPLILLFCLIGAYSMNNNVFDVFVMLIFGAVGYLFRKLGYESAPLILAFVLGPILELSLRQSLITSKGSLFIFVTRPISAVAIILAFVIVASSLIPPLMRAKGKLGF